jgi:uncharacterized membrane protein
VAWRTPFRVRCDVYVHSHFAFSFAHAARSGTNGAAGLPAPGLLVTITGILELLGAIGLLMPRIATVAAYALSALLVAMFPANVRAARAGVLVVGRRATPLIWRLPLQLFWIAALLWVARASASANSILSRSRKEVIRS